MRRAFLSPAIALLVLLPALRAAPSAPLMEKYRVDPGQVPTWSNDDLAFFLHGSMGTEVVPEKVLRSFIKVYPDLFPVSDLSNLGLIADTDYGWPIGFSRRPVKHLGSSSALGINCASCHVAEVHGNSPDQTRRLLGATSHFDVEQFFGAVLTAAFKTSNVESMWKFLEAYVAQDAKAPDTAAFARAWARDSQEISAALTADPFGAKSIKAGELYQLAPADLEFDSGKPHPCAALSQSIVKLFHNMRAALHVPDEPPKQLPPPSGPGRNDAFGLLSAALLNSPQAYAPSKFGLAWNVDKRHWVHWDGNTNSPLARNLLASLGLGAPSQGKRAALDFAVLKRQTDLSEVIRPPPYPFGIDANAVKRGAVHFETNCASCHTGPESDKRLYSVREIGTDPHRAELFTARQADGFNKYLAELELEGYAPPREFGVRSTGKYFAATLNGVWARSPYLHNGSVRTMQDLLSPPAQRARTFHRGSKEFDQLAMGYTDAGPYSLDSSTAGNSNAGHDYGTSLSAADKHDLIEYLKTL